MAADEPGAAFLRDGLRPVDVARADLAALTSWRSKLALIREHVCPPIAYMRTKYAGARRSCCRWLTCIVSSAARRGGSSGDTRRRAELRLLFVHRDGGQ